ncbi:MAG: hypothetical protein R3A80_09270 [Bdellovibrionota bacterium]
MKKLLLGVMLLGISQHAQAWTQVAICGTGDALGGVDVYTDGEGYIIQMLSMSDEDAPEEYRTNIGDLNPTYDINADLAKLSNGEQLQILLGKETSFQFGGATTDAAFLNLKTHPKFSYEHNSMLSAGGTVYSLFCNSPENMPNRN